MKHSWSNTEKRRFLETHTAVGTNAMGETLYALKERQNQTEEETPAPPLTDEELKDIEALKEQGILYSGNDVEPW